MLHVSLIERLNVTNFKLWNRIFIVKKFHVECDTYEKCILKTLMLIEFS